MGFQNIVDEYSKDAKTWRIAGEFTYSAAVELFRSENAAVWFGACLLGHHALEVFLKSALIHAGHRVSTADVWGHELVSLSELLSKGQAVFPILLADVAKKIRR
jgi:hypothetical protein